MRHVVTRVFFHCAVDPYNAYTPAAINSHSKLLSNGQNEYRFALKTHFNGTLTVTTLT